MTGLHRRLYDSQRDLHQETLSILTRSKTLPSVRILPEENGSMLASPPCGKAPSDNKEVTVNLDYICDICLAEDNTTDARLCCGVKVCLECFAEYLEDKVGSYTTTIECLRCDKPIASHMVLQTLERSNRIRVREDYARRLRGDKKCPRCQFISSKYEGMVCPRCQLSWCFRCEATHEGMSCDTFTTSYKSQLKNWAKSVSQGQWNAQRCPKCKVYIQRAAGCDHMHCLHCRTHFCYKCGCRFRHMKFFGDHYSKLSVFGCKYKFKPNKPMQRKLIRSAVFVGRLVAIPLAGVGALCGVTMLALLAVPMYAGYRVHQKVTTAVSAKECAPRKKAPNDENIDTQSESI